jgi:protein required for attachment to host cells
MLGMLRATLSQRVADRITATVEKDYLHLDPPVAHERIEREVSGS